MLKEHKKFIYFAHRTFDTVLLTIAFIAAYFTKQHLYLIGIKGFSGWTSAPNYYLVLLISLLCFQFFLNIFGLYDSNRRESFSNIFQRVGKAFFCAVASFTLILYMLKISEVSRIMLVIFVTTGFILVCSSKIAAYWLLQCYREKGYNLRNVLIIGGRERAKEMIRQIVDAPNLGFRIVGCIDESMNEKGEVVADGVSIIGSLADYHELLLNHNIDEVIFAIPLSKIIDARNYIGFAEQIGVNVHIMPDWQINQLMYKPKSASLYFSDFNGMPTISLSSTPGNGAALLVKSIIDYFGAGLGLLLLSPLFIALAGAVKLSSRGPVFFRQIRCGVNGRRFTLYKFRTMVEDAEEIRKGLLTRNEVDGPVFKITDDPRITSIGKFLRKTSLDELPQLFNVLRGEMSLVGPRPPLPEEILEYKPWQRRRLSMKPGITCIWQVYARNTASFENWMKMDLEYIDNWSLKLDMKLMFGTIPAILLGTGR